MADAVARPRGGSPRVLVIGNSGSGKSTFARQVGAVGGWIVHDLDTIHWDGRDKRTDADALDRLAAIVSGPAWIVEGVYGLLGAAALPRATHLAWLDLAWDECRANLLARGPQHGWGEADEAELLAWAEAYQTRNTPSSRLGHGRLFDAFAGRKRRYTTRPGSGDAVDLLGGEL